MAALTAAKDKVLVVGANAGSLKGLLAKITSINTKHGPFTCVLCLGDLFPASSSSSASAAAIVDGDGDGEANAAGTQDGASEEAADQDTIDLVEGRLAVPVPTYFMLGERKLPKIVQAKVDKDAGEVTENLSYLGKATSLTLASGLKIGVFGGAFDLTSFTSTAPVPAAEATFSSATLQTFLSSPSSSNLDILLTHVWPSQIYRYSEKPVSETVSKQQMASWGVPALQSLFGRARPKYAFSGEKNLFWEREPFVYPASGDAAEKQRSQSATRFLSLGHFGNTSKQRWFYAFTVTPTSSAGGAVADVPADVTPCPFDLSDSSAKRGTKRPHPNEEADEGSYIFAGAEGGAGQRGKKRHGEPPQGYTCKICNVPGHFVQDCPEKVDAPPRAGKSNGAPGPPPDTYTCRLCNVPGHWIQDCPMSSTQGQPGMRGPRNNGMPKDIAPEECWFCLSNPKVTKHLIASIGSETYLTLPKGQLIDTADSTRSLVPGGGHCLIIPIAHYPTLASVPTDLSAPIIAEIDSYKRALRTLYAAHNASPLAYEVSRAGMGGKGGHAHIQICPIPNSTPSSEVERIFRSEAAREGYALTEDPSASAKILEGGNYLRIDLPDGKKLVHEIRMGGRFSLQFGRATTALVLDDPNRSDWKACAKSDDEEGQDALAFKQAFAQYDPSG